MKFFSTHKVFLLIVFLSIALRFFQLGSNPNSLDWDEVSLGYNAYSILKTGKDEYGNTFPISIRSFDDYKPPLYVYLAIPGVALFGLNEFSVRFPSAIMGVFAVIFLYFLVKELFINEGNNNKLALASAFLLSISPWHLQFSRAAFEANLALTLFIASLWGFFKWLNSSKKTSLFLSAIFAALSLYAYHSARLVVPITFLIFGLIYWKTLFKHKHVLGVALIIGIIILSPLLYITTRPTTIGRFSTVSIFTNPGEFSRERERLERNREYQVNQPILGKIFYNDKVVFGWIILRNYFEHFNLDFLFLESDTNPRHHAYGMGLLYLIELPFLIIGAINLSLSKLKYKKEVFLLVLVGPLASAVTASTPHAIRGYLMLPGLIILISFGLVTFINGLNFKNERFKQSFIGVIGFLFLINIFFYLNLYYLITPIQFGRGWQYGYKELVKKTKSYENEYDEIIVTNYYDQPHIYFAFYNQINPTDYQVYAQTASSNIGKYHFRRIESDAFEKENALVVVEPKHTPKEAQIIDTILFQNGEVAFNFVEN